MKLLLFSDLHLDAPFRWAGRDLARTRRIALRQTLVRICELAGELDVHALLSGGDLYEHDRFGPDTAAFVREQLARVSIPVYMAPGNHDWYGPQSMYRQVQWSPNVHVFEDDELTPVELAEGVTLWGAAHRAPANTDGFLDDGFKVDRGGINLALFHGSERGQFPSEGEGKVPHAPFSAPQVEAAGLHHALLGHFHRPRHMPTYTYPGNPDPLTFGEDGERGAVLFTLNDDGSLDRQTYSVARSKVSDVEVDLTAVTSSSEITERVRDAVAHHAGVVRVTLVGEVGPDIDLQLSSLDGVAPHLDAIVPRIGRISVGYDLTVIAEEATVRGQFVRDVQAAELDDEERRRVLITALRALDGRSNELEVL